MRCYGFWQRKSTSVGRCLANFNLSQGILSVDPPISYVINSKVMKRYDFIYASPQFKPVGVQYLLDESILASSDHALVIADFEILTNQPEK